MKNDNNRNTIVFIVCAAVLLIVYQVFVLGPAAKKRDIQAKAAAAAAQVQAANTPLLPNGQPASAYVPRDQALAAAPRVRIDTPALTGSVSLKGGRIDDLFLKNYRETIQKGSPLVELFRPQGTQNAYFAELGWVGANIPGLPGGDTTWSALAGAALAPGKPVTLTYDNGAGLKFVRTIAVDDRYMFTVADTVTNSGAAPVQIAPYGSVQRQGLSEEQSHAANVHEGAIGVVVDGSKTELQHVKYKDWKKKGEIDFKSSGGWFGVTDKYWMASLIPAQHEAVSGKFRVVPAGQTDIYETNYVGPTRALAPGQSITETTRVFAGAKTVPMLQDYQYSGAPAKFGSFRKAVGPNDIPRFDEAVDWGRLWFFTRPIFTILEFFFQHVGNFGVAILLLTVVVKLLFFPLANKSYESLTKMKKIQPKLEEIKKKFEKDPAKLQQETMGLYQREKINPFMGCLPMLVQIPVFLALYKVLSVTIEMRHAPFFGFIRDLSARDPSTIWNLFGLIPYDPAHLALIGGFLNGPLHIGALALAYGVTMWLNQAMSPQMGDPIQQRMMQFFPLVFTFIMAQFAVGLLVYWAWQNILTILQQYVIMRRFKVDNPIDDIIARLTGKAKATTG